MTDSRPVLSTSRRRLFKTIALLPVAAAGASSALATEKTKSGGKVAPDGADHDAFTHARYAPTFFNAVEWECVGAVCDQLIPHDEHGPGAVELGVPEFLDRHMQTPYAAGDIWYMQGPFLQASEHFGY